MAARKTIKQVSKVKQGLGLRTITTKVPVELWNMVRHVALDRPCNAQDLVIEGLRLVVGSKAKVA